LTKDRDGPPGEHDGSEEAWIVGANPEHAIRIRSLSVYLSNGGALKDVRLVEGEDDRWTLWVRLANRPGEFRLNLFKSDQPKTYRDVDLAIATVRDDFGYYGSITLATEKTPATGKTSVGPIVDSDEN
jgi:hypothetical protein